MTENSAGTNNIDSLAERAKEMLERVRGPVDDASVGDAVAPREPEVEVEPEVEAEAEPEVEVEPEVEAEPEVEVEPEVELATTSRLGALADQAKDSLSQVGATQDDPMIEVEPETLIADEPSPDPETAIELAPDHIEVPVESVDADELAPDDTDAPVEGGIDLSDLTESTPPIEESADPLVDTATELVESNDVELDGAEFDAADLGALIESDLEDLDSIGTTEIIAPSTPETDDIDVDLAEAMDIDWAETTEIELPDVEIESPDSFDSLGSPAVDPSDDLNDRAGFIESFDAEDGTAAIPMDDFVEDKAVTDLIALDDIDPEDIEPDRIVGEDSSLPTGLGLGAAAVAGGAAVAGLASSDGEPAAHVENLDGDIKAAAATRSYTSVPKREPKIDSDLNDLFIESETPDKASGRNYALPILIVLAIAVLLLLWVLSDDSDSSDNATGDAAATSVEDGETDDSSAPTTVETAPATTEAETTTEAPSTVPEPTIPPTVWSLVGVESGTSQFTELGAPLGLQAALEQTVDADGNPLEFTLFAPSDEAISALTQDQRDALAQDATAAEQLIDYHFVDQRLTQELLLEASGGELMTRAGLPIFVDTEGGDVILNGTTRIALSEFEAGNGNILVVDSVLQQPTINTVLNLGNIQFEVISSVITDGGKAELQKAVDYFNENPEANALIEGHTDTDGDADANLRLSDRRARAVREFLIEQGIDGSRLVARGFGETQPVLIDGVEDKNASRRIEFTLQ